MKKYLLPAVLAILAVIAAVLLWSTRKEYSIAELIADQQSEYGWALAKELGVKGDYLWYKYIMHDLSSGGEFYWNDERGSHITRYHSDEGSLLIVIPQKRNGHSFVLFFRPKGMLNDLSVEDSVSP